MAKMNPEQVEASGASDVSEVVERALAQKPRRNPIRFREAWAGIQALIANPDDTSQVFKIIRALAGNSHERNFRRFLKSENGPRILAERRALVDRLSD